MCTEDTLKWTRTTSRSFRDAKREPPVSNKKVAADATQNTKIRVQHKVQKLYRNVSGGYSKQSHEDKVDR